MTTTVIVILLIVIAFLLFRNSSQRTQKAPYFLLKQKLDEELIQANFSSNKKKIQEINLQKLWLDSIKSVESVDLVGSTLDEDKINFELSKLTGEELKFPTNLKFDDLYHFPFIMNIIREFGKYIAEDKSGGYFTSELELPFPKKFIKKAIYFWFDYSNIEKPLYEVRDKGLFAGNLNMLLISLDSKFIDTSEKELPKGRIENIIAGSEASEKQMDSPEEENLDLIDWLDDEGWLIKGVKYAENGQLDLAIHCYKKSLEFNAFNVRTLHCMGLAYRKKDEFPKAMEAYERALKVEPSNIEIQFHKANALLFMDKMEEAMEIYHEIIKLNPNHGGALYHLAITYAEKNRPDLEIEYMKKAAEFGVKEAVQWLDEENIK